MARNAFFSMAVCLVLLLPVCLAYHRRPDQESRRKRDQGQCQMQRINALRPTRRLESQAGHTEVWDQNEEQLDCAGVAPHRHTIRPRGLLLPTYSNAPSLIYVIEGEGYGGVVLPGCPESFQSFERSQTRRSGRRFGREESAERIQERGSSEESRQISQQRGDEHQKVHALRQGDVIALPAGVSAWAYNDGQRPLVLMVVQDTANFANQLDREQRFFLLAGSQPQSSRQQERESTRRRSEEGESRRREEEHQQHQSRRRSSGENFRNVLSGFDSRILAESFGIDERTAEKLQNPEERNGFIVEVESGLRVAKPRRGEEERESERERRMRRGERESESSSEEEERRRRRRGSSREDENGMEELFCNARLHQNIDNPNRADIFSKEAGHLTTLNNQKLPILNLLKLSAEKGRLRRNAILAPHWNINAHSVVYAIRGRARMQIVDDSGNAVFDDTLEEGEIVVVPMNYAVVNKAEEDEFEWISFKTNENALTSPLAGKTSVVRGLPEDVLANAFQISREEARRMKYGRDEVGLMAPRSRSDVRIASQ